MELPTEPQLSRSFFAGLILQAGAPFLPAHRRNRDGAVGRHAAHCLGEKSARVVAVADSRGTALFADGFDLSRLDALKAAQFEIPAPDGPRCY